MRLLGSDVNLLDGLHCEGCSVGGLWVLKGLKLIEGEVGLWWMDVKWMEERKKKWKLIVESKAVTRACPSLTFHGGALSSSICLHPLPLNDEGRHEAENASRSKQATSCSRRHLQDSSSGHHAAG
jgi:hypothetical protein